MPLEQRPPLVCIGGIPGARVRGDGVVELGHIASFTVILGPRLDLPIRERCRLPRRPSGDLDNRSTGDAGAHWSHGMFQSPSPSVPGSVEPDGVDHLDDVAAFGVVVEPLRVARC